jgi:hypothetical protein
MASIDAIINDLSRDEKSKIAILKEKTINVPLWQGEFGLVKEYNPQLHPVMNKGIYPDLVTKDGVTKVTRIILDFQRLATKRMSELINGIPIKRVYKPKNDKQKEVATYLEAIMQRNRINSVNTERLTQLFGSCEFFTLWYATDTPTNVYGFDSPIKLRCRNFSPMLGDDLYPYFDEYGDMIAMSIGYTRKVGKETVEFFDTYSEDRHIKWSTQSGEWEVVEDESISLLKIPGVYCYRPTPIWEDTSRNIFEIEWSLSRQGNYIRENSKPRFIVFADEVINYGDEGSENKEFKSVMQYPKGSSAGYVTWQQSTEALKYHVETLRNLFFTQLQLPDWSYEKMSQQALSGESRKQMFIDAELKVVDESGRLLEAFDREINVVKAYLKIMLGNAYAADIDALQVTNIITPYRISDRKEEVETLLAANGQKPIMSQRESIEYYGRSEDVDRTIELINEENRLEDLSLTE